MFFLLLTAVFVASIDGGGAQVSEESCDTGELQMCVDMIPRTQVGLPRTREELDAHCQAYGTGISCMDAWMKRCFPTDSQKFVQQQIGGARLLMQFLCNNKTGIRRDFLREPACWAVVSPEWSTCVDELQFVLRDISERSDDTIDFNKNAELCCARDAFVSCVAIAGEACSPQAGNFLQRMAWVLAQDVATCNPRVHCAASWAQLTTPMLTALSGALLYPPRPYV